MKLRRSYVNTIILIAAILAVSFLCACSSESNIAAPTENSIVSQSDDDDPSSETTAPESNHLVIKVPNASNFTMTLNQTSMTIYYIDEDEAHIESAIKRF